MSWHFLERWVEKANQHSTLIGKFWITFLIVCRMVIVASVGDRVYSDEQSEFKCNTMQPGCTNVCFNKFSPISHLRFWSFQIILVATPSVMYIIYSGHNPKRPKAKNKKDVKKKLALSKMNKKQRQAVCREIEDEEENVNNNNNNNNNSNSDTPCKVDGKNPNPSPGRTSNKSVKTGKMKNTNIDAERGGKSRDRHGKGMRHDRDGVSPTSSVLRSRSNPPRVLSTLINYKNGDGKTPVKTSVIDPASQVKAPWQEMRWNSLVDMTEETRKGKSNNIGSLWRKVKDDDGKVRQTDAEKNAYNNAHNALNAEVISWVPSSSDDDNRTKKSKRRRHGQSSLTEADMYGHVNEKDLFEKDDPLGKAVEVLIPTGPYPPEYPGTDYGPPQWQMNAEKMVVDYPSDKMKGNQKSSGRGLNISKIEIVRTRMRKPRFTRHFYLYLLSVFARLALEVLFLVSQVILFGFTVPDMYKCERWPCPNKVDCFTSRPMEKTIFLYFMLIYSCICVLLNGFELLYLVWVYIFGRPKLVVKQGDDSSDGGYEGGRNGRYGNKFLLSDCDDDYDSEIAYEEDYDALMQNGFMPGTHLGRNGQEDAKDRGRRYATNRGAVKLRDKFMQDRMVRDMEHEDLDIIIDAEQDIDDYDLDIAQNDPVDELVQMEMASAGSMGGNDDYA